VRATDLAGGGDEGDPEGGDLPPVRGELQGEASAEQGAGGGEGRKDDERERDESGFGGVVGPGGEELGQEVGREGPVGREGERGGRRVVRDVLGAEGGVDAVGVCGHGGLRRSEELGDRS
jgi:hypothetical protein